MVSSNRGFGVGRPTPFYQSFFVAITVLQLGFAVVGAWQEYPVIAIGLCVGGAVLTLLAHLYWPQIVSLVRRDPTLRDFNRLKAASDKLDEVCRSIDACLSTFDPSTSPTGNQLAAYLLKEWPASLTPLWQAFTDSRDITICIRYYDRGKLKTRELFPNTAARERSQPDPLELDHTICGRAYREQRVIIVPKIEDDPDYEHIKRMWPDLLDHIRSIIAAPVWIRRPIRRAKRRNGRGSRSGKDYVGFVLQIDSPVEGAFQDTIFTHILTKLCAHKLGLIIQFGMYVDQVVEVLNESRSERTLEANSATEDEGEEGGEPPADGGEES